MNEAHLAGACPQAALWLVRHGQTDWNVEGRYQGQADLPLNETGRQQARDLAGRLHSEPFAAVISSDLQRARETAEILAAPAGMAVIQEPRLREIALGDWEGKLFRWIQQTCPAEVEARRQQPLDFCPPNGESARQVAERATAAANEIAAQYAGQAVLVVSHGLTLATLAALGMGRPLESVYDSIPDNARPVVVLWPPENGQG